jgi:hypothetical protein
MEYILIWILSGIICGMIANNKERSYVDVANRRVSEAIYKRDSQPLLF